MLHFKNITKTFKGPGSTIEALKDVSFSLSSGEYIAVQGPSGCGKSTLLLTAGALLKPDHGSIVIDGDDPYKLGMNKRSMLRAKKIGFIFQQFHLVPYLTVLENVLMPSTASYTAKAKDRAMKLIQHFKMEHRANHLPSQLSTGERQRTALARALLNKPKIILADEPTGNLDEENGNIVLCYLSEFAKNGGSVLIVTHDSNVSKYADRIIRLAQGAIVSNTNHN